jgi:hypothetical protein
MGNQRRTDTILITGGQSEKDRQYIDNRGQTEKDRHYIDNRGTIREGQTLH